MLQQRRRRQIFVDTGREFLIFIGGIVLSALFSVVISVGFNWTIDLTVFLTLILIVGTIFFVTLGSGQLRALSETLATRVDYVEETFEESHASDFHGDVYVGLDRYVRQARERILVLASPVFDAEVVVDNASRRRLLNSMVNAIRSNAASKQGFHYLRILQLPTQHANRPMPDLLKEEIISPLTYEHCRQALLAEQSARREGQNINVEIRVKVADNRISACLLIDQRWLAVPADGVSPAGRPYIRNFLILDDLPGVITPRYEGNFHEFSRGTRELSLDDFPEHTKIQ